MTEQDERPRLLVNKHGQPTKRRVNGPAVLNARMCRMIELMVCGHPDDPSRTPYTVFDAARSVGYRKKAARHLRQSPVFREALREAEDRFAESGIRPAIPTLEELDVEEGTKRLPTVAPFLPEPVAAGYVVRPPSRPRPIEADGGIDNG